MKTLQLTDAQLNHLRVAMDVQYDIANDTVTEELFVSGADSYISVEDLNLRRTATEVRINELLAIKELQILLAD